MELMESKGYSLWLMPSGENYNIFENLIKKLANEYNGPVFQPHVTLLGEIILPETDAIRKTEQLVDGQKPFSITLKQIDYEDFYFRTLFVKAVITKPLQTLYNKAKEIFAMDVPLYMPHLSLLYGNYPREVKKKIIQEIGRDQTALFKISSVHLFKGGKVEQWQKIKEFTF